MNIEVSWELVQAALQIFGYIGVTTIAIYALSEYRRRKCEFQKIKNVLILELEENVFAADAGLGAALSHTAQIPLLIDDGWRMALSNDQMSRFVIPCVDNPLRQLSSVYSRVGDVNQMILLKRSMAFSIVRTSPQYDELLRKMDGGLVRRLEELIPAMKRAKEDLYRKDFKKAFMKNMVYAEYAKSCGEKRIKKVRRFIFH